MKVLVLLGLLFALSHAAWVEVCNQQCPSIMMAIGCINASLCMITGGESNTPMGVYYTQDQGQSWNRADMEQDSFMLMNIDAEPNGNAATAGMGVGGSSALLHSTGGTKWLASLDQDFMVGQAIRNIKGSGEFAYIGTTNTFSNTQGVATSTDGGVHWTVSNWPGALNNLTEIRYGAFPSATTWYINGGQWPSNNVADKTKKGQPCYRIRKNICIPMGTVTKPKKARDSNGYLAVMSKTTDGGKTFQTQKIWNNLFYFNDMDCWDENNCLAAGEGFNDGSTKPGGRVLQTTDGGSTWNEVLLNPLNNAGMGIVRYVSATEAWAAGGEENSSGSMEGTFYHTTDNGKTWEKQTVPYIGDILSMQFVDSTLGFAAGVTEFQTSQVVKYTP